MQAPAGRMVDVAPGIGLVAGAALGGLGAVVREGPLGGLLIAIGSGLRLVVGAAVRALRMNARTRRAEGEPPCTRA